MKEVKLQAPKPADLSAGGAYPGQVASLEASKVETLDQPPKALEQHVWWLVASYRGEDFSGLQSQPESRLPSVQDKLNEAVSALNHKLYDLRFSARTDKGVHASYQVMALTTDIPQMGPHKIAGLNRFLPPSIRIWHAMKAPLGASVRTGAFARHYRFLIYQGKRPISGAAEPFMRMPTPLSINKMNQSAHAVIGEHDFSSFRSRRCQSLSAHRRVYYLVIRRYLDWVAIDIGANAFLQRMVRNLVGALLKVGKEEESPNYLETLLQAKDRAMLGVCAPPNGLHLIGVDYPEAFALPPFSEGLFYVPMAEPFPLLTALYHKPPFVRASQLKP